MKIIIYLKLSLILAIIAQMQAFSQSFTCTPIEEFRFNGKKSDSIFSVPIPRSPEGVTHMFIRTGDPSKYNFCQMSKANP